MKIAVRRTPSTSQNRIDDPSWSLIRLVAPTGTTKNRPTARASDSTIVAPQTNPPIGWRPPPPLPGPDRGVRRYGQSAEADLERLRERHDAADDRQPEHSVALGPRD